jgi:ribosomal protein S18 acetylase RimI-like enzyme
MWEGTVRIAAQDDLPFLQEMLYEAAFWRENQNRPPIAVALAHPELSKILKDWGRAGDTAVIALAEDDSPVGAAWCRYWTIESHSYGFVDSSTPELGIAVRQPWRRRGVGRRLLQELMQQARQSGVQSLSLSVEPENPSRLLYEQLGFKKVGELGQAWTMVASLRGPGTGDAAPPV